MPPVNNRNRVRVKATPGLDVTLNGIDAGNLTPDMQAYLGMAPDQQLGNAPVNAQQLPGTNALPNTPQSDQQGQEGIDDPMNYFNQGLTPEDIQQIRNIYSTIPEEQHNDPQALENAITQAEQNNPQQAQSFPRLRKWARKAAPFLGAIGGAIAGWYTGGPMGVVQGAATGAGAAKKLEQMVPKPGTQAGGGEAGNEMGAGGNPITGWPGTPGEVIKTDRFNPQQNQALNDLLGEGMADYKQREDFGPIQQLLSGVIKDNLGDKFDFGPIRDRALKRYKEETLPGLFNRFTSLGKGAQSTGAFQGMLARGGADLNEGLAELEQNYNLKRQPMNLKQQQLLQGLLGQQQNYDNTRRNTGLDAVRQGMQSPYEIGFKSGTPRTPGIPEQAVPVVLEQLGNMGMEYLRNKRQQPVNNNPKQLA